MQGVSNRYLIPVSCLLLASALYGQQFRGSITGRVVDAQQAAVPGVKVTATKVDTQAKYQTVSNATGQYTIPFMQPGAYTIEAEASGFKRYLRENVQVNANQQVGLDIHLELGKVVETVNVSAAAPVLTTSTASTGQTISSQYISDLPMNGRTPLSLAQIAFGVVPTSDPRFQRPFDNSGPSSFSMGGAPGRSNELLLDGSPDTTRNRRVAYNPPVDTVDEVSVESFQADAAYGNTGGGTVNVVSKGGTNEFHGHAYNFNQVSKTAATDFFVNKAGQKKSNLVFNQWGVNAGGPVIIPKVFNGRDKVFWFFAYEGIKDRFPEPVTTTVPTSAERTGDFSALLSQGSNYQIYDPLSGKQEGSRVRRMPLENNIIPADRLSPIALNYLKFLPAPNQTGRADGRDNYLANSTRGDDFNNETGRIDFNLSERNKFFFNFRHNERQESRGDLFKNIATGNFLKRINWGSTLDDVYTFNPTTILDTRLNWTRFTEGSHRPSYGFDMTSLGFPSYLAAASSQPLMPIINFSNYNDLGQSGSFPFPFDQFQIFSTVTKISGAHTVKVGADLRLYRESNASFGNASGRYDFSTNWTRGPLDNSSSAPIGQDLASFLLGLPTGGSYDVATYRSNQSGYYALFLQDDWRAKSNLTLNLGIRYEREVPTTERYNRQLVGFDSHSANAITNPAMAAYAANPIPELPVANFNPVGGVLFARPGDRAVASTSSHLFSPRIGFAWTPQALGRKTVFRGGFGIFYFTEGLIPSQQPGYFQSTPLVASLNGYLTPAATLGNPFPNGIEAPVGNTLGINTYLGHSVTYYNPSVRNPYSVRWNFTIQRELAPNTVLEVGYMGNHAVRLTGSHGLNWIPRSLLSTLPYRDQATIDELTANVANPFQGLVPGTSLNGSSIKVANLVRPFPQYGNSDTGLQINSDNFGSSYFHMLQVRVDKRFSHGLGIMANYQFSKLIEKRSYLNPSDFAPEKRVASEDRPNRLVVSSVYQLPFGPGKLIGRDANPFVARIIGGWSVSGIYTFSSGAPLSWGNDFYYGGDLNYDASRIDGAFNTDAFNTNSKQQLDYNIRTFPSRFGNLRNAPSNNFDISIIKDTTIKERLTLQYRAEFFNAMNHPAFNSPNTSPTSSSFGKITSQRNLPRTVQMALKLNW